ncbi:MAG: DUF4241 domain-containing protein [Bacteroidota bacterium]
MKNLWSRLFGKKVGNEPFGFKLISEQHAESKTVTHIIEGEATTFCYAGFQNLKANSKYDRFFAGQLILPTGFVVCTDPLMAAVALPQSWRVEPGEYPVYLYIAIEGDEVGRVCYAELAFRDAVPDFWELSLISDKLLKEAFDRKMNGMYPVDAGLSCFADLDTFRLHKRAMEEFEQRNKDGNFYTDVLEAYFEANANTPESSRGQDWANYKPAMAAGNVIMFGSGWGDGYYPRYVGYNSKGNVVKMVTEFIAEEGGGIL